jgi:hypothetical protein
MTQASIELARQVPRSFCRLVSRDYAYQTTDLG